MPCCRRNPAVSGLCSACCNLQFGTQEIAFCVVDDRLGRVPGVAFRSAASHLLLIVNDGLNYRCQRFCGKCRLFSCRSLVYFLELLLLGCKVCRRYSVPATLALAPGLSGPLAKVTLEGGGGSVSLDTISFAIDESFGPFRFARLGLQLGESLVEGMSIVRSLWRSHKGAHSNMIKKSQFSSKKDRYYRTVAGSKWGSCQIHTDLLLSSKLLQSSTTVRTVRPKPVTDARTTR